MGQNELVPSRTGHQPIVQGQDHQPVSHRQPLAASILRQKPASAPGIQKIAQGDFGGCQRASQAGPEILHGDRREVVDRPYDAERQNGGRKCG